MATIDVNAQLKGRFSAPLEHWERRHIVVWHDADGEFADEFASIATDSPPSRAGSGGCARSIPESTVLSS